MNGQAVQLTPEELVDAERKRQVAEKMQGCPFFAGIKKEDAARALQQHEQQIVERKESNRVLGLGEENKVEASESNQDAIFAAMNAFNAAPTPQKNQVEGEASDPSPVKQCPYKGQAMAA